MADIISASQARQDSLNAGKAEEKNSVARTIERATEKGLFAVTMAKLSDSIVAALRKAGYVVGQRENEFNISWDYEAHEFEEVASLDDLSALMESDEKEVYATFTEDVTIPANGFAIPAGKEVHLKVDGTVNCSKTGFDVANGGKLFLTGEGTITTSNKTTSGAVVEASGKDAVVTIDGVTIDCFTQGGKQGNYAYGVYLLNDASANFKSGTIKCAYGSCISTNNTTGGNTVINVTGGELLCDGSYAIYLPAQGVVNIKGDAKVQGVNVRMGHINIGGDAQILPTTLTEEDYDNIGREFRTSGCVWVGDTIAVMAGTYTDDDGTECVINIGGNAKVHADFRSAIGIYTIDTLEKQNVQVKIADMTNVTTSAEGFNAFEVYDHDYIAVEATKAGKQYEYLVNSDVKVLVNNKIVYPAA